MVSKNWEPPESDAPPDSVLVLDADSVLVTGAGWVLVLALDEGLVLDAGWVLVTDAGSVWVLATVKVLVVGSDVEWELDVHC